VPKQMCVFSGKSCKSRFVEVVNEDGEKMTTEVVISCFVTCLSHLG
jgi:hypothetical protein